MARISKKARREFARMESQRFMGEPVVEPGRPLWTIGRNVPGRKRKGDDVWVPANSGLTTSTWIY